MEGGQARVRWCWRVCCRHCGPLGSHSPLLLTRYIMTSLLVLSLSLFLFLLSHSVSSLSIDRSIHLSR